MEVKMLIPILLLFITLSILIKFAKAVAKAVLLIVVTLGLIFYTSNYTQLSINSKSNIILTHDLSATKISVTPKFGNPPNEFFSANLSDVLKGPSELHITYNKNLAKKFLEPLQEKLRKEGFNVEL